MKTELPNKARRPVPSVRLARLAGVLPARACFAVGRKQRPPVRGSALPGRFARRCSPPTAAADRHSDVPMLIKWPLIRGGSIRSYEHQNDIEMLVTKRRSKCRRISGCNKAQVWPKPPPHAVNVLLALLPLRSTLTAAAFRPRLLLGSGFGKSKAGALSFHKTHLPLISGDKAIASKIAMEHAAAAAIASIQLLKLNRWLVRLCGHVPPQLAIICTSFPLPFAFRVVFLASTEGCWTFAAGSSSWTLRAESGCFCALAPRGAPQLLAPRIGPRSTAFPFSRRCCAGFWIRRPPVHD